MSAAFSNLSKRCRVLALCALFLSSAAVVGDSIIFPTVNGLFEQFPDRTLLVNFVLSGDYLVVAMGALVADRILARTSPKTVLVAGGSCMALGGIVFSYAGGSLIFMCLLRCVQALGIAFSQVSALSILSALYPDGRRRRLYIGAYYASTMAFAMGFSAASGILAVESIWHSYRLYWAFVPISVCVLLFVPRLPSETAATEAEGPELRSFRGLGRRFWAFAIILFVMYYVVTVRLQYASVFIVGGGLGNEADTGFVEVTFNLFCGIASLTTLWFYRAFRHHLSTVSYLCVLIGYVIILAIPSLSACYPAFVLCGLAMGLMDVHGFSFAPLLVPESKRGTAIAVITSGVALMSFLTPYITTAVCLPFGSAFNDAAFAVPTAIASLLVIADFIICRTFKPIADAERASEA